MKEDYLINKALTTDYVNWGEIDKLILKAKRKETKERLRKIQSNLYRKEEYFAGCL